MHRNEEKNIRRLRRKAGIRKRILGSPASPRLTVFRSTKHIYAQVIDDLAGKTLASASSVDKEYEAERGGNCSAAQVVGALLARRARKVGIEKVIFDRNGYRYHGRIKALADAARKEGLKF